MIKELKLANFKSHKRTTIELSNLTILCGSNGVGKSSLIQILLLLREAFIKDRSFDILDLKSNPVKVGTANDAIYEFGEVDGIKIDLKFDNEFNCNFYYEAASEIDRAKSFINLNKSKTIKSDRYDINNSSLIQKQFANISLFNTAFQYISAARRGPQESYPKDDKIVDVFRQISVIEGQAEYFAHFLDKYRNDDVLDALCLSENETIFNDLYTQVIIWEKYIFDGADAAIQDVGKLGYTLTFSFNVEKGPRKKTTGYDAKNVGFGLTYVLPLLIAILSSKKDSIVIIENPEAHLHPGGIARLGELICLAAQAGIQIIIETHSDHIINGVLVQSKKFEDTNGLKGISKANVSIYQFDRDDTNHSTIATKIIVEKDGRIYEKPSGFFDQIAIDLRDLIS